MVCRRNQEIGSRIIHVGTSSWSLWCGRTLVACRKVTVGGADVGRVGVVEAVDTGHLIRLTNDGYIPVIAPVAVDIGQALNVNADLAASSVAAHIDARKLLLMTDVEGVQAQMARLYQAYQKTRCQA